MLACLNVIDSQTLAVPDNDTLKVNMTCEWRVGIFVVVDDEAFRAVLTVNDSINPTVVGTFLCDLAGILPCHEQAPCVSRCSGTDICVNRPDLDLFAMVAEASVSNASVRTTEEDDLVVLIGSIKGALDSVIWAGTRAIAHCVGASGRHVDVREQDLVWVVPELGCIPYRIVMVPLWTLELWAKGVPIICHLQCDALAVCRIGAVMSCVRIHTWCFACEGRVGIVSRRRSSGQPTCPVFCTEHTLEVLAGEEIATEYSQSGSHVTSDRGDACRAAPCFLACRHEAKGLRI